MIQYVLSTLAGIAVGVVAMRLWQGGDRASDAAPPADVARTPAAAAAGPRPPFRPTTRHWLLGAGGLALAAAGVTVFHDTAPTPQVDAGTPGAPSSQSLADVDTMIARLEARLKANPSDGEGYRMLAWSLAMTGHPDRALAPYRRALELLPKQANVHEGYGEALAGVAGGKVTPEAKAEFAKAVALDPADARARYFLGKWQAQNGQPREALEAWIKLANGGAPDAPWQADLRRDITTVAASLGVDVTARLTPAPAAAAAPALTAMPADQGQLPALAPDAAQAANGMPAAERDQMVRAMVERLASRQRANPRDADGWVRLLRSRMVLGDGSHARDDLATARAALAGQAADLARVNAAAREFGVPGAQ